MPAPRLLVAIVTYDGERFALDALLDALLAQSFQDFDILVVDNTVGADYVAVLRGALAARFPAARWRVDHVAAGADRFRRILLCREAARQAFLADERHSHLFFLDSDVILPPHAFGSLLALDRPLVTGVYLVGSQLRDAVEPVLLLDLGDGNARQATIAEVLAAELLPIGAAGLGCALVRRDVVAAVPFRLNERGCGEDICFFRDAVALGVAPVACCSVRCLHLHFPVGDSRNGPYDLARYRLG